MVSSPTVRCVVHLEPRVKEVVLLIGFIGVLLDLSVLKVVTTFLSHLGYYYHTKLKATGMRIILYYLFTKTKNVKI